MRLCIVSKFPPTEGGIAAGSYWRVRRLLADGHSVEVITNSACTESEYTIDGCNAHLDKLCKTADLNIHNLCKDVPWHTLKSKTYLERLVNKLIQVIDSKEIERIESDYLVPYGIAGYFTSLITGVPHVIRHGGSDLSKFLQNNEYRELLLRALSQAHVVITDEKSSNIFKGIEANVQIEPLYEPETDYFCVELKVPIDGPPVYAFIGKINYFWKRKGLDKIIEWYINQPANSVRLRVIGQGVGQADFLKWANDLLIEPIEIEPFVPPWQMNKLLAQMDYVFDLKNNDPINSTSMIALEAKSMGLKVINEIQNVTNQVQ